MQIGVAFFLWIGVFNLVMPAQLWACARTTSTTSSAASGCFRSSAIGASLGAWTGAALASALFERVGSCPIMLIAAAGLPVTLLLTQLIERRVRRGHARRRQQRKRRSARPESFQLILSQRYLLFIALFVLVTNIVNTLGDASLAAWSPPMSAHASRPAPRRPGSEDMLIGAFYGRFFAWVNFLGFMFSCCWSRGCSSGWAFAARCSSCR